MTRIAGTSIFLETHLAHSSNRESTRQQPPPPTCLGVCQVAMVHSRSEDDRVFQNLCRGSGSGLVVIFLPLEYAFVLLQLVKICVAVAVVDDPDMADK